MNKFYRYNAKVLRVVDGDTIDCLVYLGFKSMMKIRFRLEGYDAPETWRPKNEKEREQGNKATQALTELIGDRDIIIESSKFGKYRYLCKVFVPENLTTSVNAMMINKGHIK